MATGGIRLLKSKPLVHILPVCLCAFVLSLAAAPHGFSQASPPQSQSQLTKGLELLSSGRLSESVKAFNEAKQAMPLDPRPYFYCGMALAQAGHLPDAAGELSEAVYMAQAEPEYHIFQAHLFVLLKQTQAAEKTLEIFADARGLRQLSPAWLRLLADDYYRLGMASDALRVLDRWAALDPKDARIDLYRGQAYVLEGQSDKALESFESSIAKSNLNPLAYFEMGKILYAKNQLPAAKQALLKAVSEDRNNPEYVSELALVDLSMNDPNGAIKRLQSVVSEGTRFPNIFYVLGRAYRSQGDRARAAEYMAKFQQVTAADRDQKERTLTAERPLAQAERELEQGHAAVARALFEKAARINPNRWEAHAFLADMFLKESKLDLAYPHLLKMEQIDTYSAVGNFLMARYWFKRGDYERAKAYAEKVRAIRPDNSEVHAFLAKVYSLMGEKQQALREEKIASGLAPNRSGLEVGGRSTEGSKRN